ncbi:MAG: alanyl-tRNA editing protein [Burkholderiaceae bacterium]|jgi:misacylated tRNA(Ala) deacylase
MSTCALFRSDAYLRSCEAQITEIGPEGIEFDQTVFYPLGGGQAGDRGRLRTEAGVEIVLSDARKPKRENATPNDVLHVPEPGQEANLTRLRVGERVVLEIDWDRRFRHMRFHTATHLLCAIVHELVDGCSITAEYARLDFAMTDALDRDDVESRLHGLVAAGHEVTSRWISDEELLCNPHLVKSMSVKPPLGFGQVRLMEIGNVDLQPCGGTHVRNTAEIGPLNITKIEKKSARTRRITLGFAHASPAA